MRFCFSLLCLFLLACTQEPTASQKLSKDYTFVVNFVEKIQSDRVSQIYYSETISQGGDLRTLVTASMKDPAAQTPILYEEDPRPWTIVIEEGENHSYYISAYGASDSEAEEEIQIDLSGIQ